MMTGLKFSGIEGTSFLWIFHHWPTAADSVPWFTLNSFKSSIDLSAELFLSKSFNLHATLGTGRRTHPASLAEDIIAFHPLVDAVSLLVLLQLEGIVRADIETQGAPVALLGDERNQSARDESVLK